MHNLRCRNKTICLLLAHFLNIPKLPTHYKAFIALVDNSVQLPFVKLSLMKEV